jgi:hypothetical protein
MGWFDQSTMDAVGVASPTLHGQVVRERPLTYPSCVWGELQLRLLDAVALGAW